MAIRAAMFLCLCTAALAVRSSEEVVLMAGDGARTGVASRAETQKNRSSTRVKPGDACDCYPRQGTGNKRVTKDGLDYTVEGNTCCQEDHLICEKYGSGGECRVRIGEACSFRSPVTTYCAYGAYASYGHKGAKCSGGRCCIPNFEGNSADTALSHHQPIYNEPKLVAKGNQGYMDSCCSEWAESLSKRDGYMFKSDQAKVEGVLLCTKL